METTYAIDGAKLYSGLKVVSEREEIAVQLPEEDDNMKYAKISSDVFWVSSDNKHWEPAMACRLGSDTVIAKDMASMLSQKITDALVARLFDDGGEISS